MRGAPDDAPARSADPGNGSQRSARPRLPPSQRHKKRMEDAPVAPGIFHRLIPRLASKTNGLGDATVGRRGVGRVVHRAAAGTTKGSTYLFFFLFLAFFFVPFLPVFLAALLFFFVAFLAAFFRFLAMRYHLLSARES